MLVCGLKLTHDAGLALIDDGVLIASVEVEKLDNRMRHAVMPDLRLVAEELATYGLGPSDVDRLVVDGWWKPIVAKSYGHPLRVAVAPYMEEAGNARLCTQAGRGVLPLADRSIPYTSYPHVTTHVLSSYCTSPFAARGEDALVLVWDGGSHPCIYEVVADPPSVRLCHVLSKLQGKVYPVLALHLEPFRDLAKDADAAGRGRLELTVPGKVMALAGKGSVRADLLDMVRAACETVSGTRELDSYPCPTLQGLIQDARYAGASDLDLFATFEFFIGNELVRGLRNLVTRTPKLCLAGGSALNIKWNARIRETAGFDEVWIPPFTNDSGSAIGAACAEYVLQTGHAALRWNVYRGPALMPNHDQVNARRRPISIPELATLLATEGEPLVVLHGSAELGPRALGNRSVLAPATDADMRARLNFIKEREDYRPVSPVCLEEYAPYVFDPGCPDPYMLYEHRVRTDWIRRVPAVVHADGSARLQTVTAAQHPWLAALLEEYRKLTGIPLLCNTSANLPGRGFFPDIASALQWGRARYVWSDGMLYTS